MDEAASALRLTQESKPEEIMRLDQRILTLQIELESLRKEDDVASAERREKLEAELKDCRQEAETLTVKWQEERGKLDKIKQAKEELEKVRRELESAQRDNDYGRASELKYSEIPRLESQLPSEDMTQTDSALIHEAVTADDIAVVVSRTTGIPVTKLTSGHAERLIHMEDTLKQAIRGQDEALHLVADAVRMQRAGLNGENRPLSSFFFLGPTGVGKTELSRKLASFLFSSESAMVRFDMSEFQEKHTVSRLIGRWVKSDFGYYWRISLTLLQSGRLCRVWGWRAAHRSCPSQALLGATF